MRVRHFFILALLLNLCGAAHAETDKPLPPVTERKAEQPQIIFDEERQAMRFLIDGKEVMRVDADGLKVLGDISYGGSSTATGSAWIEEKLQGDKEAPASTGGARAQ